MIIELTSTAKDAIIRFQFQGLRHSAELERYLDMERRILKAVGDYCVRYRPRAFSPNPILT